jgi:asparagine synthase (glutamine-hydrolysing)
VGVLLSGGIDSSAVCALAAKNLGYSIRTYTVGFSDFDGNEFEEATQYAQYLGTVHTNVVVNETEFVDILDRVAWFMDEPTATSSSIPLYYLTKVIKEDVKVVLTGQGADEPLAGYPRYRGERLYGEGLKVVGAFNPHILRGVASCLGHVYPGYRFHESISRAFRSLAERNAFRRLMNIYYLFDEDQKNALLKEPMPQESNELLARLFMLYDANDNVGRMLYIDTRAWLSDDLLIYGDKATMVNSIEARVPILDKDLINYIESIPSKYKLSRMLKGKMIHKKACEKWIPKFVLKRPKRGFDTPIYGWFRKELLGYVREQLLNGRIARTYFNIDYIEKMIEAHKAGYNNYERHIFALLMLEKWAAVYDVAV